MSACSTYTGQLVPEHGTNLCMVIINLRHSHKLHRLAFPQNLDNLVSAWEHWKQARGHTMVGGVSKAESCILV